MVYTAITENNIIIKKYYKCDQLSGLLEFIDDISKGIILKDPISKFNESIQQQGNVPSVLDIEDYLLDLFDNEMIINYRISKHAMNNYSDICIDNIEVIKKGESEINTNDMSTYRLSEDSLSIIFDINLEIKDRSEKIPTHWIGEGYIESDSLSKIISDFKRLILRKANTNTILIKSTDEGILFTIITNYIMNS